jgi:hypothetical protein
MQTEVLMKRVLFDEEIRQSSKTEFFSANDLIRAGNKYRVNNGLSFFELHQYLSNKNTKEFISELDSKYGKPSVITKRGRYGETWVHPLVFIDIALAINPKLKVEVYQWMFDHLIKNRNDSGDSYKEMSGAIYTIYPNKQEFPKYIIRVADYIRKSMNIDDWNSATEEQLKTRDKIHIAIKLFCNVLKNPDQAVRLGVSEYIKPQIQ